MILDRDDYGCAQAVALPSEINKTPTASSAVIILRVYPLYYCFGLACGGPLLPLFCGTSLHPPPGETALFCIKVETRIGGSAEQTLPAYRGTMLSSGGTSRGIPSQFLALFFGLLCLHMHLALGCRGCVVRDKGRAPACGVFGCALPEWWY